MMSIDYQKYPFLMKKPRLIYKYARLNDNTKSALKESYLWFSSAKDLNDPFDLQYRFSDRFLQEVLDQSISDFENDVKIELDRQGKAINMERIKEINRQLNQSERFRESLMRSIRENIYYSVCCFTEKEDDILMWSHYAENHSGVCLIYDLSETPELWNVFKPVKYSEEYPICDNYEEVNTKGIFTKSVHWSYEREWRVASIVQSGRKYINRKALKGVIFGRRADLKKVKEVFDICTQSEYDGLEYFAMQQSAKEYKLKAIKATPQILDKLMRLSV